MTCLSLEFSWGKSDRNEWGSHTEVSHPLCQAISRSRFPGVLPVHTISIVPQIQAIEAVVQPRGLAALPEGYSPEEDYSVVSCGVNESCAELPSINNIIRLAMPSKRAGKVLHRANARFTFSTGGIAT